MTVNSNKPNIAERIYQQLKKDIFDFCLLPGDRFSESEIAERMQASRTPVREALYRLERDGYVLPHFRSRWQVRPFDLRYYEELYDIRTMFESEALGRLHERRDLEELLAGLMSVWCCDEQRPTDSVRVAELDEQFHFSLVALAGNREMATMHRDVCERLRIVRRLDFIFQNRIDATYQEHGRILLQLGQGEVESAKGELRRHIDISKNNVCNVTRHRIQQARIRLGHMQNGKQAEMVE